MSYREIRNFIEIMRSLGYPRLISMENFRRPNFELVADILFWMVKLYDPDTSISDKVDFENDRVEFLCGIASLMASKARLKLNTKKLYASDGRAVQELLKLASLLYKATKSASTQIQDESIPPPIKVQEVKAARTLASDITQTGAKLYDLLANEVNERQERLKALRFLDQAGSASESSREHEYIERCLREIIEKTRQSVEDMRKECDESEADSRNIQAKIQKKQEELERTEKRLRSLENVRPQFMDEVEKLEKELQRQYEIYIEKYRNLDYLEHELQEYVRKEEEKKQERDARLKKMRERLNKEEVELLRGGKGRDDDDDKAGSKITRGNDTRQQGASGNRDVKRVQGSMTGGDSESSEGEEDDEDEDDNSQSMEDNRRGESKYGGGKTANRGAAKKSDADSEDFVDDDDEDEDDDEFSESSDNF